MYIYIYIFTHPVYRSTKKWCFYTLDVYICVCVCVCIYIYIYIYLYMYIYIYRETNRELRVVFLVLV